MADHNGQLWSRLPEAVVQPFAAVRGGEGTVPLCEIRARQRVEGTAGCAGGDL